MARAFTKAAIARKIITTFENMMTSWFVIGQWAKMAPGLKSKRSRSRNRMSCTAAEGAKDCTASLLYERNPPNTRNGVRVNSLCV